MTQQEERRVIYRALKAYRKKYEADYYCIILTPDEGQKVEIPFSGHVSLTSRGEVGEIIDHLVEKEVLHLPANYVRKKNSD